MEVARWRGRRRKKLLDDLKDRRGYDHLKEEALDRPMRRYRFGGGFGPVVGQITEWMNDTNNKHSLNTRIVTSLIPNTSLSYWENLYCFSEVFISYIYLLFF